MPTIFHEIRNLHINHSLGSHERPNLWCDKDLNALRDLLIQPLPKTIPQRAKESQSVISVELPQLGMQPLNTRY